MAAPASTVVDIKSTSEDTNVDVEGESNDTDLLLGSEKTSNSQISRELMANLTKKIQTYRIQYQAISKIGKDFQCYAKGCNSNSGALGTTESSNCYSPMCLQKARVRKELLALLRRVNSQSNIINTIKKQYPSGSLTPSILEQKLTSPNPVEAKVSAENIQAAIRKDLETAVASATECNEDDKNVFIPKKESDVKNEVKEEVKSEPVDIKKEEEPVDMEIDEEINVDVKDETASPPAKKLRSSKLESTPKIATRQSVKIVDGMVKEVPRTKTIQTMSAKTGAAAPYCAQENRRFRLTKTVRREEKVIKSEKAADGTEKIYSAISTEGKIYLKKVVSTLTERRKKRTPVKYPLCSTFQNKRGHRTLLVLPQYELRKLARKAGRFQVTGFHHLSKANPSIWPYPCSRPLFKTCWLYRTVGLKSLAAAALQLRILWTCLRWDDMQMKPVTTDGKHQITTETEIISLEMLKHRHVGQFLERTQYLRRKVVIPLELPKTIRG